MFTWEKKISHQRIFLSSYPYWEELIMETSPTLLLSWHLLPLEGRMTALLFKLGAQSFHFTLLCFVCSLQQDFSEPAQILSPSFSSQQTSAVMSYFISFPLSSAGSSRLTVWFICQSRAARCGCFCELISEWVSSSQTSCLGVSRFSFSSVGGNIFSGIRLTWLARLRQLVSLMQSLWAV